MHSHTGGTISLGKGSVYSTSVRQKLNTRSSTTAELVGVDDLMPMLLWTRQFMEGQGYEIKDNILYQDNQSAMLLGKMDSCPAQSVPNILTFGSILSPIEFVPRSQLWNTVQRVTCGLMSLPSYCKVRRLRSFGS